MSEDITDLFENELKRFDHLFNPRLEKDEIEKDFDPIENVSNKFISEIEKLLINKDEYIIDSHIFHALFEVLKSPQLGHLGAKQIMFQIDMKLNQMLVDCKYNEKFSIYCEKLRDVIKHFKVLAVEYYRIKILSQINNLDLPIKLSTIKRQLTKITVNEFERKALDELQDEIEKDIAILKEELLNRQQLTNVSETKELNQNLDEKLDNSLTKRQWLIATSFFIDAFKLRSVDKINFARLLTVMNNGKNFQDFRAKLGAKDLITARTAEDAQKVADLFRKLDLPQIAEDIENEIERTKNRNL